MGSPGRVYNSGHYVKMNFTHEEIAQIIGASREAATCLLSDFKKKRLLTMDGSTLTISNRNALDSLSNIHE